MANRHGRVLLIVGVTTFFLLVTTLARPFFREISGERSAVREYTDALASKDYASAYNMTASEFRGATTFAEFCAVNTRLVKSYGDLRRTSIANTEFKVNAKGWHGEVQANLHFARKNEPSIFELTRENGGWKVLSYREE